MDDSYSEYEDYEIIVGGFQILPGRFI